MDNEFNKGIDYAFDFILKNLVGRVVNGRLMAAATEQDLKAMKQNIHRRCDVCVGENPCETDWCPTKDKDDEN